MHAQFPRIATASHTNLAPIHYRQQSDDNLSVLYIDGLSYYSKAAVDTPNNDEINLK